MVNRVFGEGVHPERVMEYSPGHKPVYYPQVWIEKEI